VGVSEVPLAPRLPRPTRSRGPDALRSAAVPRLPITFIPRSASINAWPDTGQGLSLVRDDAKNAFNDANVIF